MLMSYLTGELRVDAFDVSLSTIISQRHTNGSPQLYPNRPSHLVERENKLFSLISTATRVKDGPGV